MKTLYLLRHGHAESKTDVPDEARNLDDLGRKEAEYIGELMLKQELRPDLILSSHANRAYQTAETVAGKLGYPVKNIQIERDIYYTDEESVLDVIRSQEERHSSIMIAGHNPTITHLAKKLSKEIKESMPTAGLLILECQSNSWGELLSHDIKHVALFVPEVRVPGEKRG
jgi:phosphohistidine phosphatase